MAVTQYCLFLIAFCGAALAFSAQYVPKSVYLIDENGQQSDVVLIRDRREIPFLRVRRGGGSSAHASADSSASADFIPNIGNLADLARNIPTGGGGGSGAGASSFASASSSSSAGGGSGGGYGNTGYAGGLGAGHPAGYDGPILFSRVGETEGSGGHVSSAALGSRGAFSSSSISTDGEKVKYASQSGKY
ncbi:glycine-rich cell wall structural protein 1.8-like isoform X2 [Anoplophora glabripennis]|uniref:glycine-rich cell wall structural protein 1.8-like isoform X2 n=1 Tax=Anoplophora glabripennis TaxID=217634 RepID=UPI0008753372|nr:glycine-rich cell wall structural protein 1.8-like isoform X2 [Anoplophora glabripennis]